jgi:hypothetical protein
VFESLKDLARGLDKRKLGLLTRQREKLLLDHRQWDKTGRTFIIDQTTMFKNTFQASGTHKGGL